MTPICAAGHRIGAAFAFAAGEPEGGRFLWGHQCPTDGRYWAYDPNSGRVVSAEHWQAAATALGGTWR